MEYNIILSTAIDKMQFCVSVMQTKDTTAFDRFFINYTIRPFKAHFRAA